MSTQVTYDLSLDPSRVQIDIVHGFLSTCYWSPGVRRAVVEKAIANSIVVGVYLSETGKQVGFARAVTDRASFAWLCDVFVLEPHTGKGLATRMVNALAAHPDLQTLRRWMLGTRDAHEVYARIGFVPVEPGRFMDRKLPVEAWQSVPPSGT